LLPPLCFVSYLAKDLGAAGVDLDYEEIWHGKRCSFAESALGLS
jgi:hypothetical protein